MTNRTWKLWERTPDPKPIRIQPRDIRMIRYVFEHRFLQPSHIHALIPDGSADRLSRRMRSLWQHHYLERPRAIRPTKILTEELVYGLGRKGAHLLERHDPKLKGIGKLDWAETPKKQVGLPYIDHQLGIATFMVCVRLGAKRREADLRWQGHFHRRKWLIAIPGEDRRMMPDALFALSVPERGVAHHYLEVDRGNVSLRRMRERYQGYFRFWRDGSDQRSFRHFRVLTVTEDPARAGALREAASKVGREASQGSAWRALMFSDFTRFNLDEPERVVGPAWRYADDEDPMALM